jgi:hypothetical protein
MFQNQIFRARVKIDANWVFQGMLSLLKVVWGRVRGTIFVFGCHNDWRLFMACSD